MRNYSKKSDIRSIATVAVFALLVFGLFVLHLSLPDVERSKSERRLLAKPPVLSSDTLFSGKYFSALESYLLDQFPLRNELRTVKAIMNKYTYMRLDNNGIYTMGDAIYKLDSKLDDSQLQAGISKANSIIDAHAQNAAGVYFSVIPDKTWYAAGDYPRLNYSLVADTIKQGVPHATFIDISQALSAQDYYRTDTHWRQDRLQGVLNTLADNMDLPKAPLKLSKYSSHELYPFEGVYLGQSALPITPDTLVYLTSSQTDSATVWSVEKPDTPLPLYTLEKFTASLDGYDVYLDGAAALLKITNANAETGRSLILFRDSFGSSIAPLLSSVYKEITLIDLRYISSGLISNYAEFNGADILFLYSASMLNSAKILK